MNARNSLYIVLAAIGGFALVVASSDVAQSMLRPRAEAPVLVARGPAGAAATPYDREADACIASAGFWGPEEGDGAGEGSARRMVCKRYA